MVQPEARVQKAKWGQRVNLVHQVPPVILDCLEQLEARDQTVQRDLRGLVASLDHLEQLEALEILVILE